MRRYKAALDQLVQLPGMTAARLEKLWEVRGLPSPPSRSSADPDKGLADQVGALKDLNTAIAKGAGDLSFDAEHADWLGQAAMWLARETTGLNSAALGQMRQTLVSPRRRPCSARSISRRGARACPRKAGRRRATSPGCWASCARPWWAAACPSRQLASLDQVKPETFQALRDNGVEIEPRMARPGAGGQQCEA